ncbi:hypothetical protein OS493_038752 [Desmophyllum pertusum]|uniref:ABC transmembrane type-1 domain-containing protein n=1 Tax=Desmophyllum pertusum TaxID=174260 RepID=A0A9W9ZKR6_9CNID|nr:hypothetical protein OS493_038752 [Desmophyllum pertusum]
MAEEEAIVNTPKGKASYFSLLTFSWMSDVLKLGSKQPLEEKHLFSIETSNQAERLTRDLEREWLAEERASEQDRTKPRLWRAMVRIIPCRELMTWALLRILYSLASNFLPLIVWFFLRSISTASELSYTTTLPFVLGITLMTGLRTICNGHVVFKVEMMVIRLKVAVIGFVYKKILTLNRRALEDVIPGNIINIVSNDAEAIIQLGVPLNFFLFSALDIIISMAIIWKVASWQGLIGTCFLFAVSAYGSIAAKKAGKLRRNAAELIDQRLQIIKEIVSGIRAVKMYGWEWKFRDLVAKIRRKEISFIRYRGFIVSSIYALFFTSSAFAGFISITALLITGIPLRPFQVFTLLSALSNIRLAVTLHIAQPLRLLADAKTACARMQRLVETKSSDLSQQEKQSLLKVYFRGRKYKSRSVRIEGVRSGEPVLISARKLEATSQHIPPQIVLERVSCFWSQRLERPTLKNVSLMATNGQLVGITGPVGSGKTSLLMTILEELPVSSGQISCIGKIAYVPQTPWLHVLKETDYIIMLENGSVVYEGAYSGMEIVRSKENQSNGTKKDEEQQHYAKDESEQETAAAIKSFAAEEQNERIDLEEEDEDRMVGTVKWGVYWKYLRAALPVVLIVSLAVFFGMVQGKWMCTVRWVCSRFR